ncbi:hypothetical protein ACGFZA_08030 [Streptomyces sp. NPDC048211]|uniref:hypothetical protein n=1 Tax=Streptomyces sp. NPDC048211 TaxID=3365516 RepID=UPI003717FCA2
MTLSIGDQVMMRGWWDTVSTAERKYRGWIGGRGSVDGTRIVLTDEGDGGRILQSWPDTPG